MLPLVEKVMATGKVTVSLGAAQRPIAALGMGGGAAPLLGQPLWINVHAKGGGARRATGRIPTRRGPYPQDATDWGVR